MRNADLTELNKLERYLKEKGIPYERIDEEETEKVPERHQIMSPCRANWEWDAVCQFGSYGWQEGLLETMGILVAPDYGDSVEGHLTADEMIKRIEALNHE